VSAVEVPEGYSLVSNDVLAKMAEASLVADGRWSSIFEKECRSHEVCLKASHECLEKLTGQLQNLVVERTVLKEQHDALNQRHEVLIRVATEWVPEDEHEEIIRATLKHVRAGGQVVLSNARSK